MGDDVTRDLLRELRALNERVGRLEDGFFDKVKHAAGDVVRAVTGDKKAMQPDVIKLLHKFDKNLVISGNTFGFKIKTRSYTLTWTEGGSEPFHLVCADGSLDQSYKQLSDLERILEGQAKMMRQAYTDLQVCSAAVLRQIQA